jgi:hypothetical protein
MTSILKVDTIQNAAGGTPTAASLGLNVSGSVLQVVSATKTDTYSVSLGGAATDGSNFIEVSITPKSTSSKIYISGHVVGTGASGVNSFALKMYRDSTQILLGDADGSRARVAVAGQNTGADDNTTSTLSFVYLDSPSSTATLTYGLRIANPAGTTQTFYINRSISDTNVAQRARGTSTITLMEIAG